MLDGAYIAFQNTSRILEGTIDGQLGGNHGIAQICAVGYELKWEAGRLYVMGDGGTTIRQSLYNFTTTPVDLDDITKGYLVGSLWTLDNGDTYICTDNTEGAAVWVSNKPYKIYSALLTQSGTSAPVATILENTLGEVPVWSRSSEGQYRIETSSDILIENKRTVTLGVTRNDIPTHFEEVTDEGSPVFGDNFIVFNNVRNDDYSTLDGLTKRFIEIRVYN